MERKNSILIVDDDTTNLMVLTKFLMKEYTLYTVTDGATALEKANKSLPDLILLDIIMPDISGYEVLAELKKSDKTKSIPVIFISALSGENDKNQMLANGAAGHITKPFDEATVKLTVRQHIEKL
ncbi:MAG: response regulator [Treponema sp.]|nr:response regulator [Treponema sp.]